MSKADGPQPAAAAVSPYFGIDEAKWQAKTQELLDAFPLSAEQIVRPILDSWDSIFESRIGKHGIQIGEHIFPAPQIMASYLHELIPLEFAALYGSDWRADKFASEKDLVYVPDARYSCEIKTSSHKSKIFGNRSYAQEQTGPGKKDKAGYYIAVNFEKFEKEEAGERPRIRLIRFGWLDHTDWRGQKAATGQQASLCPASESNKLLTLYS